MYQIAYGFQIAKVTFTKLPTAFLIKVLLRTTVGPPLSKHPGTKSS